MFYDAAPGGPWPLVFYSLGTIRYGSGDEEICTITLTDFSGKDLKFVDAWVGYRLHHSKAEMIDRNWLPMAEPYCSTEELLEVLTQELTASSEKRPHTTTMQAMHRQAFAHLDDLLVRHAGIPWLKRVYAKEPLRRQLQRSCLRLEELLEKEANSRMQGRKARQIQQHWRRIVADPYHPVCRRRLAWEFTTSDRI